MSGNCLEYKGREEVNNNFMNIHLLIMYCEHHLMAAFGIENTKPVVDHSNSKTEFRRDPNFHVKLFSYKREGYYSRFA